jgi:hypothetical protein
MATFRRGAFQTLNFTVGLDGEVFGLSLRKPSTPEILTLTAALGAFRRSIKGAEVDRSAYEALLGAICEQVASVSDLIDEAGAPVVWSALADEERSQLLGELYFKDVMDIANKVVAVNRLGAEEKKASAPMSAPSSEETAAAALDAPPESMSPA